MEHLFRDIIENYKGQYHAVNLFHDLNTQLTPAARTNLIAAANKVQGYHYPALSPTMYMNFLRTGNRVDYEDAYMARRCTLNALVLGELAEKKGHFLDDITNGIFALCEESGWQLPAHNSYLRDTTQFSLPDAARPVLDLFACETGAQLSAIYALLKPQLDEVSPFICSRIEDEVNRRILLPYLNNHFWWMGHGEEPMCNWTIWCTQNILLTANFLPVSTDMLKNIVHKSCESIDYFLKEYGPDGCCDEGAQYYRHAGLCLYLALDLLNEVCENAFEHLWNDPKIQNIASYICNVHAAGPYYINFADCSAAAGSAGVREYLFGKAIHSPALCTFAALDFASEKEHYLKDEINLTYRLLTLLHESEVLTYASSHTKPVTPQNIWYQSVGLFIARTADTVLAVKAGDNDDSHNHNDTGSIILYHQGKPILIDVGVESYTKKTFSPNRYEIWTMQSGYHNLPTVAGLDQCAGEEYKASDVSLYLAKDAESTSFIQMNLKDAYPSDCGLSSYLRKVSLIPGTCTNNQEIIRDTLTLTDQFSFREGFENDSIIENFMTYEKPTYNNSILSIGVNKMNRQAASLVMNYHFRVNGCAKVIIETIPITDARLQAAWKHEVYRIRFVCLGKEFSLQTI